MNPPAFMRWGVVAWLLIVAACFALALVALSGQLTTTGEPLSHGVEP